MKLNFKKAIIGIVTGLCNGIFGSGGGTIVVPSLKIFLNYEEHKAHATAISIILPLTMISTYFYIQNNHVDWSLTWQVSAGGIIGGFIGANILKKVPGNVLRRIFAIFLIYAGVRMFLK